MFQSISGKFLLACVIAGAAGLAQARSDVQWSVGVQTGPVYAQPAGVRGAAARPRAARADLRAAEAGLRAAGPRVRATRAGLHHARMALP